MRLFTFPAYVTEAENITPGDFVLVGDRGLGVPAFLEVKEVTVENGSGDIRIVLLNGNTFSLRPSTEVVRT